VTIQLQLNTDDDDDDNNNNNNNNISITQGVTFKSTFTAMAVGKLLHLHQQPDDNNTRF
jgi:hypothetical protein